MQQPLVERLYRQGIVDHLILRDAVRLPENPDLPIDWRAQAMECERYDLTERFRRGVTRRVQQKVGKTESRSRQRQLGREPRASGSFVRRIEHLETDDH